MRSRLPDVVQRTRELRNEAAQEQQKLLLLSEIAHMKGSLTTAKLLEKSEALLQQSRKVVNRSQELRKRANKLKAS